VKVLLPNAPKDRQTRRKLYYILMALGLIIVPICYFLFTSGSSKQPSKPLESAKAPPKFDHLVDNPRVGLITYLSGPLKKEGQMLNLGIKLAWENLQKKGIRGELVVQDAGETPQETSRLVAKLARDPDMVALIGHLPMSILTQISPILEREELFMIVPASSHQQLAHQTWMLPLNCLDSQDGAYAAEVAEEWAKGAKVAVIHSSSTYGELLYEGFMQKAESLQLSTNVFTIASDESSSESVVNQVLELAPPVIWLAGSPFWGENIISLLAEKDYGGRMLVPRSYSEVMIEDLLGDYLHRLYILRSVLVTSDSDTAMQQFNDAFRKRYWREPQWLAVLGYDAMNLLGNFLSRGSVKRADVRDFLLKHDSQATGYEGLAGPIYFDSKGQPQRPLHAAIYRDGRFLPIPEKNMEKDS